MFGPHSFRIQLPTATAHHAYDVVCTRPAPKATCCGPEARDPEGPSPEGPSPEVQALKIGAQRHSAPNMYAAQMADSAAHASASRFRVSAPRPCSAARGAAWWTRAAQPGRRQRSPPSSRAQPPALRRCGTPLGVRPWVSGSWVTKARSTIGLGRVSSLANCLRAKGHRGARSPVQSSPDAGEWGQACLRSRAQGKQKRVAPLYLGPGSPAPTCLANTPWFGQTL